MSFWNSAIGKLCRWVLFLPIGIIAAALLESIPIIAFQVAANVELRFTLLTLIVGIFVATLVFSALAYWFIAVFAVPSLACSRIAPNPKVASVIFGTLFVLFQGVTLWGMIRGETGWGIIAYKIMFSVLLLGGTVMAYIGDGDTESSRRVVQTTEAQVNSQAPIEAPQEETDPFTVMIPDTVERELNDRVEDFVATEFSQKTASFRDRAAKFIQNRLRITARHYYAEHQSLKGFRDAEQLRAAAAKFTDLIGQK